MKFSFSLLLIALLFFLPLNGCNTKESHQSVLESNDIVVFIESRSPAHGIFSGNFGEVVLMDINSGKKYYLPDDHYYFNSNPIISYDGNYVTFLSNRIGSSSELRIKGVGGPHEIYLYDIRTRTLERFGEELAEQYPEIFGRSLRLLKWNTTNDGFYLQTQENEIVEVSIEQDTVRYMTSIEGRNVRLMSLSLSSDSRYMLMSTGGNETMSYQLILINMETLTKNIIYESNYVLFAGAWATDNQRFLLRERGDIYEYNLIDGAISKVLKHPITEDMGIIESPFYTRNEKLIFIGSRNGSNEILKYDFERDTIVYLTDDGYPKQYLDVSYK